MYFSNGLELNNRRHPILALTGLRFIAAMMVVFSHYPIPGASASIARVMSVGYVGVTLFFILSGFVLAYNYLDNFERDVRRSVVGYAVSRCARIYPVYLLCLMYVSIREQGSFPSAIYLTMMQAWSSDVSVAYGVVGPAWSISVEAFLYVCFPMLIVVFRWLGVLTSRRKLFIASIVLLIVMVILAGAFVVAGYGNLERSDPLSAHRWLYRTPLTRLFDFSLGILAAAYFLRFDGDFSSSKLWGPLSLFAIVIIVAMAAWPLMTFSAFSWDVAFAVPFIVIILGLALRPEAWWSKILSSPPMIILGESSFALYLIHTITGLIFIPSQTSLALYCLFLIEVIAISVGIHYFVERPSRRAIKALLTHYPASKPAVDL